jgi:small-conductance mechanosensitive channel
LLALKIIRKTVYKFEKIALAKKYSIYRLGRYLIILISIIIGLQLFGFNLYLLVDGSSGLLVRIGLGLQNLFCNLFSGIVLLLGSWLKVNDVIEFNEIVVSFRRLIYEQQQC